jgi:hypothetical protein
MAPFTRGLALALIAVGLCSAGSVQASCVGLSGTADGFDMQTAVSPAKIALADYFKQYKADRHLGAITVKHLHAHPQPYWRSSVSSDLFYPPTS